VIDLQVTATGPVFDGRAAAAVDDFLTDAEDTLADAGVNRIRQRLGTVLRNPTGYYASRIVTERAGEDRAVTDSRVVYGPWLEGTSSRNQATRFKGYRTFRLTTQQLQAEAHDIAQRVLPRYLERMR
jgi:hypothetical protein